MFTFGSSDNLIIKRINTKLNPHALFKAIANNSDYAYLLESTTGRSRLSEFSFIGFEPEEVVSLKDVSDPYYELRRRLSKSYSKNTFVRFTGGLVGYVSFEAARYFYPELILKHAKSFPDMEFGVYYDGIAYDHKDGSVYYYTNKEDRYDKIVKVLKERTKDSEISAEILDVNPKKSEFEECVKRAKEYIDSGDVFQVVLSKRYLIELKGDPYAFYNRLRKLNPSPYMYYIKFGRKVLAGSSPEMLLRVEGNRLETYPIAGTTLRTGNSAKDKALSMKLLNDQKERAEHVMLVDLARNDIGRVSKYGSVKVSDFMSIQQFSHVQHIVSRVQGILREDRDSIDAFQSVFPAGTVSGAPKERALEIINELERQPRGPYAGAVGYFGFNGNADLAITIRTLVAIDDLGYVQAGAGIVADSEPEKEWNETESKALALIKCLRGDMN